MKNLKIGLMLFLVVLTSGNLKALGTLRVDIIPGKRDKAQVDFLEAPDNQYKVQLLKDKNGKVLFTDDEAPASLDARKAYDFSKLPNGKYTFRAKLGNETDYYNLAIKNGDIKPIGQEEDLSPSFKLEGKYLQFTFPNSIKESAKLLLYNKDTDEYVYEEDLSPEFDIQQALNLEELHPGNYKAVLIGGDSTVYNYSFHIS